MNSGGLETAGGVALVIAVLAVAAFGVMVWMKGRPFSQGEVFRASRISAGNRLFPTQVLITPTSVVHYTPQWIGRYEHSIHMAHVASVGIDTHVVFSDVLIETTGGATPIHCRGHYRSHAVRMKALIEKYQTAYYAAQTPVAPSAASAAPAAPGDVVRPSSTR